MTQQTIPYALMVGKKGQERLEILNHICNPYSLRFLKEHGIKQGMSVLDIGCGIGIMSCELAQLVGPTGHVTGVDVSSEQLECAELLASEKQCSNLRFKQLNAHQIETLKESFDYIFCRFLLCHINNPEEVVYKAYDLLKPGGVMVFEEPAEGFEVFSIPESSTLNAWKKLSERQFEIQGTDINIGGKLSAILKTHACESITTRLCQPILKNAYERKLLRLGLYEITPRFIEAGIASQEVINTLTEALEVFEHDSSYFMVGFMRYAQVAIQKAGKRAP